MIELLILLVLNSLFCVGLYAATREEKILQFIPSLTKKMPYWFQDITTECLTCLSTIYGMIFFIGYYDLTNKIMLIYPCYWMALAGLNTILGSCTKF